MYFNKFPVMLYTLDDGKSAQLVTDIFRRTDFIASAINNIAFYETYTIMDGETPEIVADKFYGNTLYHWIILMANNIIDPLLDWPMTTHQLQKYVEAKYENPYGVHHYEDEYNVTVDTSDYPVSNYEYEDKLNESKRNIKVIRKELVADIVNEFSRLIKQ